MRAQLKKLLKETIKYKYSLPNEEKKLIGAKVSNYEDDCFIHTNDIDLVHLIYNSILDYSFNEFDISTYDYESLLTRALTTKIKYKEWQSNTTKIKYGFYGEVLLYSILENFYNSDPIISRGYFYNPLENSETKGYDSYHLVEENGNIELWFGEVKFRASLGSSVKSALSGIKKALSDDYLSTNILAFDNFTNNFSIPNTKIEEIINKWRTTPRIRIIDEVKQYNMTLVYPILLIYPDKKDDYEKKIETAINKINKEWIDQEYKMTINYKLFFILLPINKVKEIKEEVIKCIESKKPLL